MLRFSKTDVCAVGGSKHPESARRQRGEGGTDPRQQHRTVKTPTILTSSSGNVEPTLMPGTGGMSLAPASPRAKGDDRRGLKKQTRARTRTNTQERGAVKEGGRTSRQRGVW